MSADSCELVDVLLMIFGPVPIWNWAHPAVPFELMVPLSTALVLATTKRSGKKGARTSRRQWTRAQGYSRDWRNAATAW